MNVQVLSEGGDAVVWVSDDGPGIAAEMAASLFEPLLSHKAQGLGLGLSIARALARSMGGDLSLADRSGWSTSFLLRLPKEAQ